MRRLLAVVLGGTLVLPAAAAGHSLVRPAGAVVSYLSADATSLNDLTVRSAGGRIEFRDPAVDGGIDPGNCTPGEVDSRGTILQVFCPLGSVRRVRVDLGDREDAATLDLPVPSTVLGGTGSDRVTGGDADEELVGGDGNDVLAGGPGNDVLSGGPGIDRLEGGDGDDRIAARDGAGDTVICGAGTDAVDSDGFDVVDLSCEGVARVEAPPAPAAGHGDVPGPPAVAVGAAVLQPASRGGAVRVYATASEPAVVGASGFLAAAGLQLPIERLRPREVTVGGGGVILEYRLRGREWRTADRALDRGRKVHVRLGVVATDPAGASRRRDTPRIRLLPSRARALTAAARHPEPGDADGDEIPDETDNCVNVKNGSQVNSDGDAEGDACDADDDNDGIPDQTDNCRIDANPGQEDADGDGHGDACPPVDRDGDGRLDDDDNCDLHPNPGQEDLDGDDKGDPCDADDDGDRFDDQYDNCPTVYNLEPTDTDGDGLVNDQADGDGDGIGTACDPDEATVAAPPAATPTPAPTAPMPPAPLRASARTPSRQRASVVGAGPIVTVSCSAACSARTVVEASAGRVLAAGAARLAGAGTTYAFARFRARVRTSVRATLTTTLTDASGAEIVLRRPVRLRP